MSNISVCVDISDERIAAVALEGSGSRSKVLQHVQAAYPNNCSAEVLAGQVRELLDRVDIPVGMCSLLIDSAHGIFRSYFFPFARQSQIESSLSYELGEDLPVELTEMIYDTSQAKIGKKFSRVCAGVYNKRYLADLAYELEAVGIIPDVIEPEVGGLARTAMLGVKTPPESSLLVDFGRTRTVVAALKGKNPVSIQVVSQGIGTFVSAASGQIEAAEVEKILTFTDFSIKDEVPKEHQSLLAPLNRLLEGVVMALGRFEEQAGAWDGPVFVSGDLSCIKGLKELLSDRLERDVLPLAESPHVLSTIGSEDLLDANGILGALGGTVRSGGAVDSFNFRKEELALAAQKQAWFLRFRYQGLLLLLCLVFAGLAFGAHVYQKSTVLREYKAASASLFSTSLPDVSTSLASSQRVSILKARIGRMKGVETGGDAPRLLAIDELQALHRVVAQNLDVVFERLSRDARRTVISGTARNYKDVETLRNGIASTKMFASVVIKGAAADKKTGRIRFELTLGRK